MYRAIKRLVNGESGAIASELGLIAALISVSAIIALSNLTASVAVVHGSPTTAVAESGQ